MIYPCVQLQRQGMMRSLALYERKCQKGRRGFIYNAQGLARAINCHSMKENRKPMAFVESWGEILPQVFTLSKCHCRVRVLMQNEWWIIVKWTVYGWLFFSIHISNVPLPVDNLHNFDYLPFVSCKRAIGCWANDFKRIISNVWNIAMNLLCRHCSMESKALRGH